MDFGRIWYEIKRWARRTYKKIRKLFRKIVRWFRRYIRLLVRHTKAKDYSVLIYTILTVIVFVLVIVLFGKLFSAIGGKKNKTTKEPTTEVSTPLDATEDPAVEKQRQLADQCRIIYENNKDFLLLVNTANPLQDGYTFEHHTLNCGEDIDERCYQDFLNMSNAVNAEGMYYGVISAYRSREQQQETITSSVQAYMAQGMTEEDAYTKTYESILPVGYSEHETGLALDLVPQGVSILSQDVVNDPIMQWFTANSYKYGFILRYPADKVDVTGISYEPWHFRYVGIEAAAFLHNNNLTLEEFYQLMEQY